MALDSEEKRKSVSGIVTPNEDKDEDWRRQMAGLVSFGEEGAGGLSLGTTFSTLLSPMNSTLHLPLVVRSP